MLSELRVRNLATVADVSLRLGRGLNVLTGETGAGKSMLVDALALLLGERADAEQVRPGTGKTVVEGVFEQLTPGCRTRIEALGLDAEDDRVVVRREVSAEGRSRAWINGSPTTVSVLGQVGGLLVDLHGQYQTQSLLRRETQRSLLDAFAHADGGALIVAEAALVMHQLEIEESELARRRDEVKRRADYLRHVVLEVDAVAVKLGEDETLDAEAKRLSQAETLRALAERIQAAMDGEEGSALTALVGADRALSALERADPATAAWREMLDAAFTNLTELSRTAAEYGASVQENPARLAEIERRRDLLYRLRQKHGETLEAVLATRAQAAADLDLLDTAALDLRAIEAKRAAADRALGAATAALTAKRQEAADRLARGVNRLLPQLGLTGGRLSVELTPLPKPTAHGQEDVQFLVQLNIGLDARPLGKVASGGELSRLMLGLKVVLARHDAVPTLVFDEIDEGIGGEVGSQVAAALTQVAERRQVLVITHLPQIAARAERHLVVAKRARDGIATSDVEVIHGEDRVAELARMLGDAEGEAARRHAMALLGGGQPAG